MTTRLLTNASPIDHVTRRQFASDNCAGICAEAWDALAEANHGHVAAYGDDPWTQHATDLIRDLFETKCEVFFVFNGTAANSLALSSLCQSYHSILCHELAHVETDECGAPEFFSNGTKVLLVPGDLAKIDPASIERTVRKRTDIHYPKPRVLSVTQATELGTVYSVAELNAIGEAAKRCGLRFHMDGALRQCRRLARRGAEGNHLRAGVDVLCFGMTKNGSGAGEAVVFFDRDLAREFDYRCKQAGQLASKMRFMAAPWVGMLRDGGWLRRAAHANAMAARLEDSLRQIGHAVLFPRQANSVFVQLPADVIESLRARGWKFYTFIGQGGCRLMCSWDTTDQDVRQFVDDLRHCVDQCGTPSRKQGEADGRSK